MIPSIISGLGNYFSNKDANDRAQALEDEALQRWIQLAIPDPEQQRIALEQFVSQGTFTPELEHAISQDPSAFQGIVTSEKNKEAQNRALGELEKIGYEGGLRLQDKADLQDAQQEEITRDRGARAAITSRMARRGLGGSGFELAEQLQGQSASADRQARSGLQAAAHAQNRALESIMGAGELGTKLRGQEFNEKAQQATAQDAINRFNTENLRGAQERNVNRSNVGNLYNLGNAQRIHEQNVAQRNYEQKYNKGLSQQNFENEIAKNRGIQGATTPVAGSERRGGELLGNLYTNFGKGLNDSLASAGTAIAGGGGNGGQFAAMTNYLKKKKRPIDGQEDEY